MPDIADVRMSGSMPTTQWTVVGQAGDGGSPEGQAALEQLCAAYWYPLYAHARRLGRSPEDAKDSVQGFLARGLATEHNFFRVADRARGRFRTLLLACFTRYLFDETARAMARKRHPGQRVLSLHEVDVEERYRNEPVDEADPGFQYDLRWANELLNQTLRELDDEHAGSCGSERHRVLRPFLQEGRGGITYAQAGAILGISEGAVTQAVQAMRRRFGVLLRARIRQTVASAADVDDEVLYLVRLFGKADGRFPSGMGEGAGDRETP